MTTPIFRYAIDPTGISADNLVAGEVHTIPTNRAFRAVVTQYGAFFKDSLIVTDLATQRPLTSAQYYAAQIYTQPSLQYGKPIYSLFVITDATVSDQISVQYQALGGPYSTSQDALVNYINNLDLDSRSVAWPEIIKKPDGYTPEPHLHDVGDIYGFEYIVQALDRMTYAIQLGDASYNDAILAYCDAQVAGIATSIAALQAQINAHIANVSNPHQTTAAQIGAYTFAQSDANLAAVNTALTTSIAAVNQSLTTHVENNQNPHTTTAAQVGAYTIAQSDSNLATVNTNLTNSITTVSQTLTTHVNNTSNPHVVTAAQVGAYTTAQADTKLSTAVTTINSSITTLTNSLNSHTSNVSNPHSTTAAQVGAYTTAQSDTNLNTVNTNLTNAINTKAAASLPFAYLNNNVTFASVVANGNLNVTGTMFCSNDIWAFYSDERLKCDLEPISGALDKVCALNGYTYLHEPWFCDMMGMDPTRRYAGLLAGEVHDVQPEIVGPAPFDIGPDGKSISGMDYQTLQYEKMVPMLVEAIKELRWRLDESLSRGVMP